MTRAVLTVGVAAWMALGATVARAALECKGVFEFENGELHARFRCHYRKDALRQVRATCRDGEAECDADGACDGACRFSLCADAGCGETFAVTVPLRRGGKARKRIVFRPGGTRVVLRCLPSRGACGPGVTTTTVTSATATTTVPSASCTATLAGALTAVVPCTASLATGGLGLPVFTLGLDGTDVQGKAAALLQNGGSAFGRETGVYRLGERLIFLVAGLGRSEPAYFQALPGLTGSSAELRLDPTASERVHGSLDAIMPATSGGPALDLRARF
jgi:hypothetical protein